jgi:hypothetical protein
VINKDLPVRPFQEENCVDDKCADCGVESQPGKKTLVIHNHPKRGPKFLIFFQTTECYTDLDKLYLYMVV